MRIAFPAAAALALAACGPASETGLAQPGAGAANVTQTRIVAADAEPGQWLSWGRTYDEQRFSPLDRITTENVGELGLAWWIDLGTFRGNEATPLYADGVIYNTAPFNITQAIDARSGRVLWTHDPLVPRETARRACCDVVTRGLALWEGKVIIATLDGRVIALDATDGSEIWSVQSLERDKFDQYTITGSPRVFDGKVLIGNSGAERGVRGYVTAYDADTGDLLWRFYTVPGDPADGFENAAMEMAAQTWAGEWWRYGGGGTAWDSIIYDPDLGLIYVGTGNGSPWVRQHRSQGEGDNLFLSSIVALDAETGEYRWHYQSTPGEEWDYTATQPMMLADLEIDGAPRKVLMQAPKNGFFYVLDRTTGELISAEPFAPVTWATHVDMETGRPVETPEARFGVEPAMLSPGPGGAHNYNPMSYSPITGLVYFPVVETYFTYSAAPEWAPENGGLGTGFAGFEQERVAQARYAAENTRAWLTAWDPVAQEERWRVTHSANGSGGTLATAGGLVFEGTIDKTFAAYDAATGAKLWETPIQNVAVAGPISFELDGEQYVAVNAGWGGGLAHVSAGAQWMDVSQARLLVFRLGGTAALPPMPERDPPAPPPRVTANAATLAHGQALFAENCEMCHGPRAVGGLKDLRLMTEEAHRDFHAIVLDGVRTDLGMAGFADKLSEEDADAIHQYIVSRANEDWGELAAIGR